MGGLEECRNKEVTNKNYKTEKVTAIDVAFPYHYSHFPSYFLLLLVLSFHPIYTLHFSFDLSVLFLIL